MAQAKVCDIYGVTKGVKTYKVLVTEAAGISEGVIAREIDLSPRGLDRLRRFIERGTTKPSEGDANA